jgi:multicomponent Na+:H+ antiporter subunit D
MSYQFPALLFLFPLFAAISMPVVCLKHREWGRPIALAVLSAMVVISIMNLRSVSQNGEVRYAFSGWAAPIGIEWVADGLASVIMVTLSLLALIALINAGPTSPSKLGQRIVLYYTLILLLISALTGIVFAADLFNVFVFLEVAALSGYALIGVAGGKALVSAFRYLILGTLGASLYLLGVGYVYAATGTLNMADLAERVPALLTSKAIVGGLIFMFLGLGIKMAIMPLHGWLPDAYTHAPDAISPFLASLVTKVALLAWVRIMFWMVGAGAEIEHVPVLILLEEVGALAAVAGAFLALTQQEVKRMFAYGGISHIGIILIGVSVGNPTGFAGGVFYLINDAVMQAALFFLAGAVVYQYGVRTIEDLGRLRGQAPWMIGALIIMAMSMVGFPPTGGFFGKWYIILGALEAQNYVAVGAVLISTVIFNRSF